MNTIVYGFCKFGFFEFSKSLSPKTSYLTETDRQLLEDDSEGSGWPGRDSAQADPEKA